MAEKEIKIETDTNLCLGCKFWLWFEEEHKEHCSIKGCWNGSKYVEYVEKDSGYKANYCPNCGRN